MSWLKKDKARSGSTIYKNLKLVGASDMQVARYYIRSLGYCPDHFFRDFSILYSSAMLRVGDAASEAKEIMSNFLKAVSWQPQIVTQHRPFSVVIP